MPEAKHTIGDEIPYRRDRIEKRTGSLVFDRHLNETLGETPPPSRDEAKNPRDRGAVT